MKILALATSLTILAASAAIAADNPSATTGGEMGVKLSQADCDKLWMKANPKGVEKLPEGDVKTFITDVSKVNMDKDGTLEKPEFSKACEMGLIHKTAAANTGASTGASSGSSGESSPSQK